jgi:hypothetical protein
MLMLLQTIERLEDPIVYGSASLSCIGSSSRSIVHSSYNHVMTL